MFPLHKIFAAVAAILSIPLFSGVSYGANPIDPTGTYFADPEPHVWADGVLYLYCSHDVSPTGWCSEDYHVLSTRDMIHWKDNGIAYRVPGGMLYANDCAYSHGRYYLYYSVPNGDCYVVTSAHPTGPFADPVQIAGISGIDTSVFIDDNGQAYIYWGQFDKVRCAKLLPSMSAIDPAGVMQPLSVAQDSFHEGSAVIKRAGIYYYVFADTSRHSHTPTCLGYATGPTPMGPFTYRGVIIDSYGCDPQVWNNHGRIAEINGKWYVFYHRSSHGGKFLRQICVEPIEFNQDGSISEVEMTSQGAESPLPAHSKIPASAACLLSGTIHSEDCVEGGYDLGMISSGDYAAYKYVDFGKGVKSFKARVACAATGGLIEVRLDGPLGKPIARMPVSSTGGWQNWVTVSASVKAVQGVHAVYVRILDTDGVDTYNDVLGNKLNIQWFQFE
jgi:hypothetical protein